MPSRIKASALFYAVTVTLLIGLLIGSLVLITHFKNVHAQRWLTYERVAANARSAAYAAIFSGLSEGHEVVMDLYGDEADSVGVEVIPWGGLDMIKTRAWHADRQASILAFAGRYFDDRTVLELSRAAGPLHMCGDSRITGDVKVPLADVRRGYIEGRPYTGEQLVNGHVLRSADLKSKLHGSFEDRIRSLCSGASLPLEEVILLHDELTFRHSFDKVPLVPVIQFTGPTHLRGYRLDGPIVIRCNDSLSIDADNEIELAIIQAPFISVDPGAHLNAQLFASAGIILGEGARMIYPSLLAVWRDDHLSDATRIMIEADSKVQGAIVAVDRSIRGKQQGSVIIRPGAHIQGEVYAEGAIQHQGILSGTMVAQEFTLRTAASVYRGHLMDGVFQRYDLGTPWGFGCMSSSTERNILQWGRIQHADRVN